MKTERSCHTLFFFLFVLSLPLWSVASSKRGTLFLFIWVSSLQLQWEDSVRNLCPTIRHHIPHLFGFYYLRLEPIHSVSAWNWCSTYCMIHKHPIHHYCPLQVPEQKMELFGTRLKQSAPKSNAANATAECDEAHTITCRQTRECPFIMKGSGDARFCTR